MPYVIWLDWIDVKKPESPTEMWREHHQTGYQVGCASSLESAREHFKALPKVSEEDLDEYGYPQNAIRAYEARGVVYERYTIVECAEPTYACGGEVIEEVWVQGSI